MGELEIEFKVKSFSHPLKNFKFYFSFSIYIFIYFILFSLFTANSKARHKNYLKFTFDENQENNNAVVHASLNIFLNSRKYLNSKNIPNDLTGIDIEIHQTLETGRHTALFEVYPNYSIPETDDGQYMELNVTTLVSKWFHSHNTTHGIVIKIKSTADGSALSHNFVSLDAGNFLKVSFVTCSKKFTKISSKLFQIYFPNLKI